VELTLYGNTQHYGRTLKELLVNSALNMKKKAIRKVYYLYPSEIEKVKKQAKKSKFTESMIIRHLIDIMK
jgi:hypothetical protein